MGLPVFLQFLLAANSCTCDNLTKLAVNDLQLNVKIQVLSETKHKRAIRVGLLPLAEISKDF